MAVQEVLAASAASGNGRVVGLETRPRFQPDYRALACGYLAAVRTALDLTDDEFYAWLTKAARRPPAASPGSLRLQAAGKSHVSGDVLIACQAYLARQQPRGSLREALKPSVGT
jgi:hypothetical protein